TTNCGSWADCSAFSVRRAESPRVRALRRAFKRMERRRQRLAAVPCGARLDTMAREPWRARVTSAKPSLGPAAAVPGEPSESDVGQQAARVPEVHGRTLG